MEQKKKNIWNSISFFFFWRLFDSNSVRKEKEKPNFECEERFNYGMENGAKREGGGGSNRLNAWRKRCGVVGKEGKFYSREGLVFFSFLSGDWVWGNKGGVGMDWSNSKWPKFWVWGFPFANRNCCTSNTQNQNCY